MRLCSSSGPTLLGLAFAVVAVSVGACSAAPASDDGVDEGRVTRQTKKGEEFTRCWITNDGEADETFRVYTLTCHVTASALQGLPKSSVYVDARTSSSKISGGRPGETPDQDVSASDGAPTSASDLALSNAKRRHAGWTWARIPAWLCQLTLMSAGAASTASTFGAS